MALTDASEIGAEDLPFAGSAGAEEAQAAAELLRSAAEQRLTLRELEERYIDQILRLTGGNKVQAARILGIDRKTLYRRAERSERENLAAANAGG
jgi:DNA-binding NtrC family response regulator